MPSFQDWLRTVFGTRSRSARRKAQAVRPPLLATEALEDRTLFATRVWSGLGADPNWSTAANWVGNVAPQADDNLVFPAGASRLMNANDYAADTRFRSVTISASGYAIGEQSIGANRVVLLEGLVYNAPAGTAAFTVPVGLGASQTFYSANVGAKLTLGALDLTTLQTLTVDGRGDLDAVGVVSGTGGITKLGDGTLGLAGNNTFDGLVTLTQGTLGLRHGNALGSAAAGTIAGLGTAVLLEGDISVPENLVIRDIGTGFTLDSLGAIRSAAGDNALTGTITMTNHGASAWPPGAR